MDVIEKEAKQVSGETAPWQQACPEFFGEQDFTEVCDCLFIVLITTHRAIKLNCKPLV